eukprot:4623058-Prorocentrum_lima.AAC.1
MEVNLNLTPAAAKAGSKFPFCKASSKASESSLALFNTLNVNLCWVFACEDPLALLVASS